MNYTELTTEILNYTQNYEDVFVATIPVFVQQAEERIYNTVQIPPLRKNSTGNLTVNNPYLTAPPDYLSTYSLALILNAGTALEEYRYLLNKDVNFLRAAFPSPKSVGEPEYYALFGPAVIDNVITDTLSFIVAPTPDFNYVAELHYYAYPDSIVAKGTSWLGENYSPALLYGALVEAYIFMKGEQDVMAFYEKKFQDALGQLNRLGTGLERNDAYRAGQASIKVNP